MFSATQVVSRRPHNLRQATVSTCLGGGRGPGRRVEQDTASMRCCGSCQVHRARRTPPSGVSRRRSVSADPADAGECRHVFAVDNRDSRIGSQLCLAWSGADLAGGGG